MMVAWHACENYAALWFMIGLAVGGMIVLVAAWISTK